MATQAQAADHIFCSERRFRELVDEGVITRRPKGGYDLRTVRREAFRHLRHLAAGTGGAGLAVARTGLAEQQTEAIAFKNSLVRGEYVRVDSVGRVLTENLQVFRELCLAWPGANADKLALGDPVERSRLEERLTAGMHELLSAVAEVGEIVESAREQTMARSTRRSRA